MMFSSNALWDKNSLCTNMDELYDHELYDDEMDEFEDVADVDDNFVPPPPQCWYHGRLDRTIAEQRLLSNEKCGSYLIRISERKTGSYVLSFLSKNNGLTHFRVISICGDYYIGGKQFDSLANLIIYYSRKSFLLKDELLKYPVAPPEPVDDRRRVQAILPYNKVPDADNDELSFERDDIFIVHHELEGDWMWVTSLRTNESGCVFKSLVQDVDKNIDPHVGKEWFHAKITKDQAYSLLTAVDIVGSYLVRESDSTPGDYVLYFYKNNNIQRFKIHRIQSNRFQMGGRIYKSIDDIIEHYKHEQIVAGHRLGKAVPKTTDVSMQREVDIYQTVNRATKSAVSRAAILIEPGVVKKGHLLKKGIGKRGHDNKKWKNLFFALNGEEQCLYFFEHEKKTRPKGLIDLGYGAVYPVHESYFGRPNCFQVVIRALSEVTSWFFCAETNELAQEWMKLLRSYCAKPNRQPLPKPDSARQVRNLHVTIEKARKLAVRQPCRPYCTLSLNCVHVGRTKVKEGVRPLWSEEFIFDDIPPDVDSLTISIHNAVQKRSKHTSIGEVVVHFSKLNSGRVVDDWYNLIPITNYGVGGVSSIAINSSPVHPQLGSLRIRARYCNELIMPFEEYKLLQKLVTTDMRVVCALADVCGQDRTLLASVLLKIFREKKTETDLIRMLNEREINERDSDPGTLFRATTLASTLMEQYMRSTCSSFVSLALKDTVKQIVESGQSCELNPSKLESCDEKEYEKHSQALLGHLRASFSSIINRSSIFPKELIQIFGHLQDCVSRRWPNDQQVRIRVVSGFMFLRLLCPAVISPKSFNLVSDPPSPTAARTLLLVAKSLQNLANLVEFGGKESYMTCVNQFIVENKNNIIEFIENLGDQSVPLSNNRPASLYGLESDITRDLASLYQFCKEHLQDLQIMSNKEAYLKQLLGIIQLLNKQEVKYQIKLRQEI